MRCFECGNEAKVDHHVVPRVLGGTKTVPLCEECHGKIHGLDFTDHSQLIRIGQANARGEGRYGGKPSAATPEAYARIMELRDQGVFYREIADILMDEKILTAQGRSTWHHSTIYRIVQGGPRIAQAVLDAS